MAKLLLWIFVLNLSQSYGYYFDGQPKIIASDGDLIVESAKDRNITFRLQGVGCLNVNDKNILDFLKGEGNQITSRNVNERISAAEQSINDLKSREESHVARIIRLENRTRLGEVVIPPLLSNRLRDLQRRLTRSETKVERLMSILSEDNCRSSPCQNGGTCVGIFDGYICRCLPNWEGPTCSADVNECAMFAGTELGCQNGASCVNSPGAYSCSCTSGWKGIHCTRRNADCTSSGNELCGHGTCVATSDSTGYKCICDQGWKTNGVSLACTVDIDECSEIQPYCSKDPLVQCINIPGSYMCGLCPAGFTGNGHYCSDINECETSNGGCSTVPTVNCINTRGSHYCGPCPEGWQGDGKYCVRAIPSSDVPYLGACSRQNFCHPLATCVESGGIPSCICPKGYVGSGFGQIGCTPGTAILHPCSVNPCHNGGTCVPNGTLYTCICPAGTSLPHCISEFNPCIPTPCQNGGTCSRLRGLNYRCSCTPYFTGNVCETEKSECGGVLNGQTGSLKYPLSDSYPHNSRCAWLIKTNNTQVLNVTFSKFKLESSSECRFDWLQIHDGRSSSSHMIGRYCGDNLGTASNIITTSNMLYLWFRSDNSSTSDGFELSWESIEPQCGGTFEVTSHGTISSPGTPGNYPPNRDCEWYISATNGKRIQFQFFTMQLEAHESCQYDYVAIYSGTSVSNGQLLRKFCNTSHPEPLTTPYNEAVVTFHSDDSGADAGFQIHYTVVEGFPGCGGTFTSSVGEFGPPSHNGAYQKNMFCEYLIRLPADSRIKIKFLQFQLEDSTNCDFDFVEIFEGSSDKDPKVNRYCGHEIPPDYTSLGNVLLIVFKSDWSVSYEGFRISYEIVCGGLFQNETGILTSPLYPSPYEHSRTCHYEIIAPPGKAVSLSFEDFDLEDSSYPDCDFDFVQIFDGFDTNSTQIGKYCGETLPPNSISTLNVLLLVFESDASINSKGFKATYSFIDIKCGGVIKSMGHEIKPPKRFQLYEHDANCTWVIVAPKGFVVQLTFHTFSLEHSSNCVLDYVSLYEGAVANGIKIQSFCGINLPPVIQSTGNVLSLKFVSDSTLSGEGFTASYNFIDSKRVCGGSFYGPSGVIQSPGWPADYVENKDCVYIINAPTGQQIQLSIKTFEMEEHDNCAFDYLEVRNGGTIQSPAIGKYCGTNIPKVIRSYTNQLYIEFKSDSSRGFKGFDIEWDATMMGCGGNINHLVRGSIVSPNYPNPYGVNTQCDWRITVSKGSTVQLLFSDLELEENSECYFDYIEIFDGRSTAAKSLGKYCTLSSVPSQIVSSSNEVFLRLVSDINNQGRGFDLKFNTICTLDIRKHRGVIESPNFPNKYANNLNCEWTVIAPPGNKIFVAFSQFELEFNDYDDSSLQQCVDYLRITQKKSEDKDMSESDTYCERMPKEFTSVGDTIVFNFKTDGSATAGGFHLEYEVQGCGGEFNRPSGNFTTPNYPNAYPHDVTCAWYIVTDFGNVIELTINELDIESNSRCFDSLVISNKMNDSHPLNTFCNKFSKPVTLTSDSNELFIKFSTDSSHTGKGFSAYYTTKTSQCGGLFRARQGTFTSPKYPSNYASDLYCEWYIEVDDNHRVSFSFFDFSTENSCEHDSVKIYDGFEKTSDKIMATLCGNEIPKTIYNSTENKMLVVMQTDNSIESKGFSATFKTACGGVLSANESGIIDMDSITFDEGSCNWTIIAPKAEQHVTLTIVSLHGLSKLLDTRCLLRILIYDGCNTAAPIVKDLCGYNHPPPIISSGSSLTISVIENQMHTGFVLKAFYSTLDNTCGGTFADRTGQIASPSYPNSYPINVECVWELVASPGNQLILTVEKFDIEESEHCNEDYLEIREKSISGKLLGVYCGNNVPSNLPQAERFWLKFRSNSDVVGAGFLAQYAYATSVEIGGSGGVVTSPLYPKILPIVSQVYSYRITVKYGYFISLLVKEYLSKSEHGITVFDGYDENAPGEEIKEMNHKPMLSSSNILFITMPRAFFAEILFKLEWNELLQKPMQMDNGTQTTNCTKNSIVNVNNVTSINISSPGYPYGYDANQNCTWILIPDHVGYHATFLFIEIDLEDTVNCLADYVKVSSSKDLSNYNVLNRTCQVMPNTILQVHGNPYLKINFVSDYYTNRTGFIGSGKSACGSPMSGPGGVITVTKESNCEWEITVRRGRYIKFEFLNFNIRRPSDTYCDSYVLIKNGASMESPFLGQGKFCGTTIPIVEKTSSNRALVVFKENFPTIAFSSFTLRYEEVTFECGGTVIFDDEHSIIINTPNYPSIPHPHIECVWSIVAPSGELIQVDFIEQFDITASDECELEYVEIRDGGTMNGNLIGKFCGKIPTTQYSTTNMLRIKYFTDISVPMNGFKANISLATCSGFYRSPSGIIQSSHYPGLGGYEKNSICEYHVIGQEGSALNLTFIDLHLPSADNCNDTDHIEIYSKEGRNSSETLFDEIGKYCGSDAKPESILTSSEVLVRFVTKQSNSQYRGFRLSYSSSIEKCGGEIISDSGYVTSPGYPNSRPFRQYCEWKITVPKGRRVRIDILDFDFGESVNTQEETRFYIRMLVSQTVTFYNDFVSPNQIKRLGQNDIAEPVYSSDNRMLISLWMRSNAGHRGFKFRFSSDEPSICLGNLNDDDGVIESPKNASNYYCEYQRDLTKPFISGTNNIGTIGIYIVENCAPSSLITFQNLRLPRPILSPISVQYAPTTRMQFFTSRCNLTNTMTPIASPFLAVKIVTKKGGYQEEAGNFTINYKIHNCGKLISNTQSITIRNPEFSVTYGRVACAWQYVTVENAPIAISGHYGNLDCETEYINIYPSMVPIADGKKRLCGESLTQLSNFTLPRTTDAIFIEYHSSNYNPNTTFEFEIKANYSVCGGSIEYPIFEFSSPSNGSQYPNNIECIWDISSSIGYHIGLTFINRFFLENSENCTNDYLEIFDFVDNEWKLLSRVCGRSTPGPFNSTGYQMRVIFRTNGNVVGDGFTVKWEENCGGVFLVSKTQQLLTSPKYPNKYPRNLKCNYTLIAGKEDFINVDFDEFELEDTSRSCVYDNLTIYKYEDWSYPPGSPTKVGVYCWKSSLHHIRHKHKINLIFSSDAYIERKGFSSRYYLDNCGGNVTNSLMIEVPRKETGEYANHLTCLWYIKARDNQKIVIRFEYFELEHNDGCYLDAVEVYQGLKTDLENRKAMLCGNLTQHAPIINIDSNNAIVRFHSDASNGGIGFSALVLLTDKCDKTIELNDVSPSYKLDKVETFYSSNLDCHYKITAPEGYVLKMEFDHFHIANCHNDNSSCTCDYLAIFDGSDAFAEVIQKNLCGHSVPQTILSSGSSLFIRYVTDSVVSSSGFSANIQIQMAECGPTFIRLNSTYPQHVLSFPMNPGNYKPNSRCDWTIEVPDGEQVNIHFEKFELQDADSESKCSSDYLQLTDLAATLLNSEGLGAGFVFSGGKQRVLRPYFYWGRSFPAAPHTYCGGGILPDDFISSSKTVQVRFRSDETIQMPGIKLIATMSPACHRNYTSLQGRMYAKKLADCETFITVPGNYTISLYFSIFNVYLSDYKFVCTSENAPMKIIDYRNNDHLIDYVCPGTLPNPIFANTTSLMIKITKMDVSWEDTNGVYDIMYLATDQGLGCGGKIFNYAGQFSSPMYPANDRNASDCRWDITVPQNLVVSVVFSIFDMGSRITCTDNYLQIIETDIEGKETVARQYCGDDVPSTYKGNRNILSIKFKKTANFAGTGWMIQFMSVHSSAILSM